jgi:hypothetical protein
MTHNLGNNAETWGLLWLATIRKYCWALIVIKVYDHDPL